MYRCIIRYACVYMCGVYVYVCMKCECIYVHIYTRMYTHICLTRLHDWWPVQSNQKTSFGANGYKCIVRGFPDIVFLQLQDERECVFVLWKSLSVCLFVILKSVCACVRARARVCRNLYVCGVCVL